MDSLAVARAVSADSTAAFRSKVSATAQHFLSEPIGNQAFEYITHGLVQRVSVIQDQVHVELRHLIGCLPETVDVEFEERSRRRQGASQLWR